MTLPGDRRKDKTYKPRVQSPTLSEDPVPEYSVGSDGFEVLSGNEDGSEDDGDWSEKDDEDGGEGGNSQDSEPESTHSKVEGGEEERDKNEGEDGKAKPSVRPVRSETC